MNWDSIVGFTCGFLFGWFVLIPAIAVAVHEAMDEKLPLTNKLLNDARAVLAKTGEM